MASGIQIAIEGADAEEALNELFALTGIEGEITPVASEGATRDGGALIVIGAIVGITAGVVTVVDKILDWRQRWLESKEKKYLNVVIDDGKGKRVSLYGATSEQISEIISTLAE